MTVPQLKLNLDAAHEAYSKAYAKRMKKITSDGEAFALAAKADEVARKAHDEAEVAKLELMNAASALSMAREALNNERRNS